MRILTALPYAPSPIRVRPYYLLRELSQRHEVGVLIAGSPPTPEELAELQTVAADVYVAAATRARMVWNCARAGWRGEPLQAAINQSPGAGELLARLVREGTYDVVHVEHLRAAFLEGWLPSSVPRVFDAVDCISLLWERTLRVSHSVRHRLIAAVELHRTRAYERHLLGRFSRIAVTSADDAAALARLRPSAPLAVVPNGVDLEYFRPSGTPPEPATLVFSGKMSYHANVSAALHFVREILPRIHTMMPDARLRIVGSNPPPVIRNLAGDPRITVTGYLEDLRPAISTAMVAVCPVTVKVGVQNKILEAMALGVPVVATEAGAAGLAAVHGQDLLVASDPASFACHVIALLQAPSRRERVARAGRRYVETRHRWSSAACAFENLYRMAVDTNPAQRSA
ncbi:MAG: glycosyltransferase [Chloroflexi bacterium]|nr:glycosyltransferase [Chloroflexota bacterium]